MKRFTKKEAQKKAEKAAILLDGDLNIFNLSVKLRFDTYRPALIFTSGNYKDFKLVRIMHEGVDVIVQVSEAIYYYGREEGVRTGKMMGKNEIKIEFRKLMGILDETQVEDIVEDSISNHVVSRH